MYKRNVIRYFDLNFNLFTSHRSLSHSSTLKKENFPVLEKIQIT
ncbi:hypothetical protein LEP1GSC072_0614 [Leptospira noguchii str. Bonito]|nr:hypothetical protein LEP1GSC072_0614 [Leptospira noguchii str. Bonito]